LGFGSEIHEAVDAFYKSRLEGDELRLEQMLAVHRDRWEELDAMLKKNNIKEVIVYGIATDYCVKATAIDAAANAGYKVIVVEGLCKGVAPETTEKALEEMKAKGITIKNELES